MTHTVERFQGVRSSELLVHGPTSQTSSIQAIDDLTQIITSERRSGGSARRWLFSNLEKSRGFEALVWSSKDGARRSLNRTVVKNADGSERIHWQYVRASPGGSEAAPPVHLEIVCGADQTGVPVLAFWRTNGAHRSGTDSVVIARDATQVARALPAGAASYEGSSGRLIPPSPEVLAWLDSFKGWYSELRAQAVNHHGVGVYSAEEAEGTVAIW